MNDRTVTHESIMRHWTPTAFVAAGLLFAVFATLWIAASFGAPRYPAVAGVFGAAGWVAGLLGLLGVQPEVARGAPRWARVGAWTAAIGALAAGISAVAGLTFVMGITGGGPAWLGSIDAVIPIAVIVAFLAFSVASMRASALPSSVRRLLLLPPLIIVANLAGIIAFTSAGAEPPAAGAAVLSTGHTVVLLAIGLLLGRRAERTGEASERAAVPGS